MSARPGPVEGHDIRTGVVAGRVEQTAAGGDQRQIEIGGDDARLTDQPTCDEFRRRARRSRCCPAT
jgi:hypothetical protein